MSETWPDVDSIFCSAIELASPEERHAFVERACAERQDLKLRVEKLLKAHFRAGGFLESPPSPIAATIAELHGSEAPGTMVGPFKLQELLGQGGMGTVYVATQDRPVRRRVALKVIKLGMDTKEVIARFEAERQALALMDHPHIAKVLDAGATDSGRPYFVMELIRGVPINEFCDQRQTALRERLGLFIKVCQGVQHAHEKGIIHRDLKPSNVLVTQHDDVAVPKVIDFGVAKAVEERLTEQTIYTRFAQVIGSPLYMSPEQAEMSGLDVDARSDVYSLGVLLYELLTGTTPFDKKTLTEAGFDEMRRIIREREPLRPSDRVSTLDAELRTTLARQRGIDPRRLAPMLQGELDWIVLNALEKDPRRRYQSAAAMAADLKRYLDDKPVLACPPSIAYRLRKFLYRQRRGLATTAVFAVCIPLAAYGVFTLISEKRSAPDLRANLVMTDANSAAGDSPSPDRAHSHAAIPGKTLPGLVPEPLLSAEISRWQLITKRPRGVLKSASWSPDERRIAVGEANHVRIYDAGNLRLLHVLVGHSEPVTSVAWHPDGELLASASQDGTIRIWSGYGVPRHLLSGHSATIHQVAWRPDGTELCSASADGTVRLWTSDGTPAGVLDEQGRRVFCVAWSQDGKLLATGGGDARPPTPDAEHCDNTVKIWDSKTRELVRTFRREGGHSVMCVDWHPEGRRIAAAYGELYRTAQGVGNTPPVHGAGVQIWDLDGAPAAESIQDSEAVNAVAWSPDGRQLAFGGRGGFVQFWHADSRQVTAAKSDFQSDLYHLWWKRDGSRLLITDRESIREWNRDGGGGSVVRGMAELGFQKVKWSPDGKMIAAELNGGGMMFWSEDGSPAARPPRWAENSHKWLERSRNWWEREEPTRRPDKTGAAKLDGPIPLIREWAWNRNGWLAGASWTDNSVRIWDPQGKLSARLTGHRGGVESVSWSPDGEWLASGGGDSVRLWKPDGTPGPVMTGHSDEIYPVAWSPDGKWIASSGADATIRLWRPDGAAGPIFRGHQGAVLGLAWSPDSKRLASTGWLDSTIRIWNVETQTIDWQALRLSANGAVTLSPAGEPRHKNRELLETGASYVLEKSDGSTQRFDFTHFRQRFAETFVYTYVNRCGRSAAKGDWAAAEGAFADLLAFRTDADRSLRNQIADAAYDLAQKLPRHPTATRAAELLGISVEIRRDVLLDSPDNVEQQRRLAEASAALGCLLADLDQQSRSVAAFSEAIDILTRLPDKEWRPIYELAVLKLAVGDHEGYSKTCRGMLESFAEIHDPLTKRFVAWTSVLNRRSVDSYEVPLRLAAEAGEAEICGRNPNCTLGATLFRAGRYDEAIAELMEKDRRWAETAEDADTTRAYTWYFLALAHAAKRNFEEADFWRSKAEEWTAQVLNDSRKPTPWCRTLTLKQLRGEVHDVIAENRPNPRSEAVVP